MGGDDSPLPVPESPVDHVELTPTVSTADKTKKNKQKARKSVTFDLDTDKTSDAVGPVVTGDQDGQDQDMLSSSGGGGDDNVSSGPAVGGISGIAEATLPETSTEWSAGVGADSGSADNGGEHERQQREVLPLHAITDATGAADAATATAPGAAADEATSGGEAGAAGKELSSTDQAAATDRAADLAGDLAPSRPFADDNCLLHADDAPLSGEASGPTSNDDKSTGDTRGTDAQTVDPALTDSTLEVGAPQELPGPVLALDNTTPDEPQVLSSRVAPEAEVTFVTENSATLPEGDDMAVPTIVKPDDEWAETPSSKKKAKKGKKKAAAASSAWGDEPETAQQQPEEVKSIDDSSVSTPSQDEPVSLPQPAEPEGPALDDPVTAPTPAADDDEWALPASGKKSQKNKKKKGSAITSDEPVPEPETPTQTTEEPLSLDQSSQQVEPQPPTAPELAEALEKFEPALAAEAAEDEWAAPTSGKKAKKSKKKKALTVEEPEPEAAVGPELAPQLEVERSVEDTQTAVPQLETSPDQIERAPVPEAADDEWASQPVGKKGKKNKKKKESASASDEPTTEPAASEVVDDILASDSAAPEKTVDEPAVEGPSPAADAVPTSTGPASSEPVEAAGDEWSSQPAGKKSKKDKKKKKQSALQPDDLTPEAAAEALEAAPADPPVETEPVQTEIPTEAEPAITQDAEVAPSVDDSAFETSGSKKSKKNKKKQSLLAATLDETPAVPESQTESSTATPTETAQEPTQADDGWGFEAPTKKSKKGKKKQAAALDDLASAPQEDVKVADAEPPMLDDVPTPGPASDEIPLDESTTPLDTLSRDLDTSAPLTTSSNEPIEEVTAPVPEEEFPTTTKKSKKDKKKMKGLVEESAPEPSPVSEEPTAMDEAVPTPTPPEDDSFSASTGKKDKKKKGLLAAAALAAAAASGVEASPPSNDEESSRQAPAEVPDNSQATTDVPPALEEVSTPVSDEAQPTDVLPESLDQTAVADDEFPVVSKKSKKDKKKKGKSEPEPELEPEVQAEPESTQPATLSWADDIPAEPPREPEAQPEPSAVEPEEEPASVGKKSKKDKKKKGKGNAGSEPASEVATPVEDLSRSLELPPVTEDPAPVEASPVVVADAAPADEWAEDTSTKKKSKKDKKKKKGLLSDDLETPSESPDPLAAPTETVAEPAVDLPAATDDLATSEPAIIETPATETPVAKTPVVDEWEEQGSVSKKSKKKSKKNKSLLQDDPALESGAATPIEEVSQDTKALDLTATDDISPEPTPVEIQEEQTLTPDNSAPAPEEPAADDEWGAAPTKKSKKDKKKKRASQIEPETPLSADRVEDQELQQSPQVRDSSQESPLETAGASPPVEEVSLVPDVAGTSVAPVEDAVVETASAPEAADEWADFSTSKKGKKKNKKGKGVIEPEPELEVTAEPASEPVVAPASEPLVETVPQVADLADSSVPPVEDATPVVPAAEVVVEPVDEWAEPATSKKSKKNKKKGKAVTEPEPELTPETIAEPVHESVLEPTIDPVTEPIDLTTSDILPAQDAAPVASEQPAIEPVDEWAEPATTKKSKKNKKKGKGVVEVEPEPESVLQSTTELSPEPVAELAPEPVTESVSVPVGTIATDAPAATEEPVAEAFDEWAEPPTSKKGKKNKKKAKGVVEPKPELEREIIPEPVPEALSESTPEPATESSAEPVDLVTADVPVPSEEPIAEPADEWAELTTSKKRKGLNVESTLEPAVEPVPEAAVEPVTAPVVEPEAVSEPAPEVQTAVETELVAPLDDGSRNLDTPPAESGSPAEDQSSAAVDDWADFSSSKKSKKNKKKTKATDEPAPAIAEELPRAQDEIREASTDAAADPIVAAEPTPLPEQEPVVDEFADLGSKKSKKNKKKAKGLVSVEPETAAELQLAPAQDAVDSTAIEPSSTLSDPPTVLEDIPVIESSTPLDQDAIAAADDWADFGVKKNKKGKKSKGVTYDDTELPSTTDLTEPSRNTASAEPGLPEINNLAEATAIPEAEVEPVIEAEVPTTTIDEWADPGSKKSKKKKKGKSFAFDEPETTVETAAEPVATQDELVLPSDPAPIETVTLPQEVETSTEQASSAPVDEWNDFGSTKKSKKKKKGKGSVLDELEPATSAPLEAPSEAAIATQVVSDSVNPTVAGDVTAEPFADTPADTEASTPVDDWASGFSTKKSKKGKKKAKGSAFDEPEPLVEPAAEETPDVIVEAPVEVEPVPAAEPEVANPVDEWAESSNKKSKKDKKKKRGTSHGIQ
ncbi:hypothetical protein HYQ44_000488 [Verticillium longisporum]|nr:hypothetical protein HYQ44_000488 [Verticillium longisporum]